ncbi:MAG: RluA family pseudouridine synthase [Bacteroidaceae bacterium]|nr:RluA family pseudouridine synthase [Bacteroidaceae bacterium]
MKHLTNEEYAASKYIELNVEEQTTLLDFILSAMKGVSRNKAKDILAGNGVMVNRKATTRHDEPLKPGDIVQISRHKRSTTLKNQYVRIVYEDKDLVVVEKKEGILSMPSSAKQYSVKKVLDEYFEKRHFKCRAHTVHRLDRETSGLMIYAKSIEIAQMLEADWHNIVYDRRYLAVVDGEMEQEGGTVKSWLKDNKAYVTYSSPEDNGGKYAVTHYRVLKKSPRFSLIELKLETGRKNQIRVHMQDIGHPVTGDFKYGKGMGPVGRLCLHAYRLHFFHPRTGEPMEFETPCPKVFRNLFEKQGDK